MGWILTKLWLTGQISGKIIMSVFGGKKKKKKQVFPSFCKGCIWDPRLQHGQFMKGFFWSKVLKKNTKTKEDNMSLMTIH